MKIYIPQSKTFKETFNEDGLLGNINRAVDYANDNIWEEDEEIPVKYKHLALEDLAKIPEEVRQKIADAWFGYMSDILDEDSVGVRDEYFGDFCERAKDLTEQYWPEEEA